METEGRSGAEGKMVAIVGEMGLLCGSCHGRLMQTFGSGVGFSDELVIWVFYVWRRWGYVCVMKGLWGLLCLRRSQYLWFTPFLFY